MIGFSTITVAFVNGEKPITVHNNITKIVIPSNSYNEGISHLHLRGFSALEELEIGSHCFDGVETLLLNDISELESIMIGKSTLMNTVSIAVENLPVLDRIELKEDALFGGGYNSSLVLTHLPLLSNLTSEGNSFAGVRNLIVSSIHWLWYLMNRCTKSISSLSSKCISKSFFHTY